MHKNGILWILKMGLYQRVLENEDTCQLQSIHSPVWTQEPYCPPRSKYSLWWGGRVLTLSRGGTYPGQGEGVSILARGRGYLPQSGVPTWLGEGYLPQPGVPWPGEGVPTLAGWGVSTLARGEGVPILAGWGVPTLAGGYLLWQGRGYLS